MGEEGGDVAEQPNSQSASQRMADAAITHWPIQTIATLADFSAHTTSPKASSAVRALGQVKNTFARASHNICTHGTHAGPTRGAEQQELHGDVAAQVGTTMSLALDSGLGIAVKEARKEGTA